MLQQSLVYRLKDPALRSREKFESDITVAGDLNAVPVESDGVKVAFPGYKVNKDEQGRAKFYTYTKKISVVKTFFSIF